MPDTPTLYDWAGGLNVFEKLMTLFYDKVMEDELLQPLFKNMSPEHVQHVTHFVVEVFGGPALYTTEDGGSHHEMIAHHIGKMLSEAHRKRWMDLLLQTADETGLASDPEFRSSLLAYLEWGTRIAVINSQQHEAPTVAAAMPKWGWGETGGPYQPETEK